MVVEKIFAIFRAGRLVLRGQAVRQRQGVRDQALPVLQLGGQLHEASGCVFMAEDISAKTELEEKIFQAEKLSTISMLSAGMAHEINNPLGSILTNVQNLIDDEETRMPRNTAADDGGPPGVPEVDRAGDAPHRPHRAGAAELRLRRLRAAPGSDVNEVVLDVIGLVSHSMARENQVRIDTRLADGLPPSVVSTDELKQVVINLLRNSVQAIPGEGRILVSTRMEPGGARISLAVADTGTGIPKEIVPRIFDPFFTTKANGEGTGLGLSVVYGIVTKYAGTIDVRTREGGGTRMTLGLPVRAAAAGRYDVDAGPASRGGARMKGTSILIVDDEEGIRHGLENLFQKEGFTVHTAASFESAVSAAGRFPVDAAIVDVRLRGTRAGSTSCRS